MNYNSEEYEDRENKILEESEESRKKHKEIEERYRKLVEKKVSGFNIEESLAILKQEYGIEFNKEIELPKKSPVKICLEDEEEKTEDDETVSYEAEPAAETEEDNEEEAEEASEDEASDAGQGAESSDDEIPPEPVKEDSEDATQSISESEEKSEKEDEAFKEKENRFMEAFPEDGRFKAFYEENIGPLLDDPEFREIRDFIYEEEDFSNEKYNMVLKAFEEKTGISYGSQKPGEDSINQEDGSDGLKTEESGEEAGSEKSAEGVEVIEGAQTVHAVPIENEKAIAGRRTGRPSAFYMGASLTGIVVLVAILIIYAVW